MSGVNNHVTKLNQLAFQIERAHSDTSGTSPTQSEWKLSYINSRGKNVNRNFTVTQNHLGFFTVDDKFTNPIVKFFTFAFKLANYKTGSAESLQRYLNRNFEARAQSARVVPTQMEVTANKFFEQASSAFGQHNVTNASPRASSQPQAHQVHQAHQAHQANQLQNLNSFRQWANSTDFNFDDGLVSELSRDPNLANFRGERNIKSFLMGAAKRIELPITQFSPSELKCLAVAHRFVAAESQYASTVRNWAKVVDFKPGGALARRIYFDARVNSLGAPEELQQQLRNAIEGNGQLNSIQVALLNVCGRAYAAEAQAGHKAEPNMLYAAKSFVKGVKNTGYNVTEENFANIAQSQGIKGRWDLDGVKYLINSALEHPYGEFTRDQVLCLKVAQDVVKQHYGQFMSN